MVNFYNDIPFIFKCFYKPTKVIVLWKIITKHRRWNGGRGGWGQRRKMPPHFSVKRQ